MSLTDQTLYCRDCNQAFTFTQGEQEFYASRGLTNSPSRCPNCRAAHKQGGGGRGSSGGYGNSYRDRDSRQMRDAANGGGIYGHKYRPQTGKSHPPYSRRRFCAATAWECRPRPFPNKAFCKQGHSEVPPPAPVAFNWPPKGRSQDVER